MTTYIHYHVYLIVVVSKSWKCWFGCGYEYEKIENIVFRCWHNWNIKNCVRTSDRGGIEGVYLNCRVLLRVVIRTIEI